MCNLTMRFERRGVAPPKDEAALSQSSTASLPHRKTLPPRSLEPIVMRGETLVRGNIYYFGTVYQRPFLLD
jgi:hypothetical protein